MEITQGLILVRLPDEEVEITIDGPTPEVVESFAADLCGLFVKIGEICQITDPMFAIYGMFERGMVCAGGLSAYIAFDGSKAKDLDDRVWDVDLVAKQFVRCTLDGPAEGSSSDSQTSVPA